jgi:hypothetical protein
MLVDWAEDPVFKADVASMAAEDVTPAADEELSAPGTEVVPGANELLSDPTAGTEVVPLVKVVSILAGKEVLATGDSGVSEDRGASVLKLAVSEVVDAVVVPVLVVNVTSAVPVVTAPAALVREVAGIPTLLVPVVLWDS